MLLLIVDSSLNLVLLLNSVLGWFDIKFEDETVIHFLYLCIKRECVWGIISKIDLDVILHLEDLLSIHIKEYQSSPD